MKKFKSILCGALAFVAGSVALSACGVKTKTQEPTQQEQQQQEAVETKTIISLAEAKEIIVKALAIEDNQLQTQSTKGMMLHAASAEEGNRDIFEKMGRFTADELTTSISITTKEEIMKVHNNIEAVYHNQHFETCLQTHSYFEYVYSGNVRNRYAGNSTGYFVDNNEYVLNEYTSGDQVHCNENITADSELMGYKTLFSDETFDKVYDSNVIKENNKDGYSITLHGGFWEFYMLVNFSTEEEIENLKSALVDCPEVVRDTTCFKVVVNFDSNHEIFNVIVDAICVQPYHDGLGNVIDYLSVHSSITATKTNTELKEPEWVTEYKKTHA